MSLNMESSDPEVFLLILEFSLTWELKVILLLHALAVSLAYSMPIFCDCNSTPEARCLKKNKGSFSSLLGKFNSMCSSSTGSALVNPFHSVISMRQRSHGEMGS